MFNESTERLFDLLETDGVRKDQLTHASRAIFLRPSLDRLMHRGLKDDALVEFLTDIQMIEHSDIELEGLSLSFR